MLEIVQQKRETMKVMKIELPTKTVNVMFGYDGDRTFSYVGTTITGVLQRLCVGCLGIVKRHSTDIPNRTIARKQAFKKAMLCAKDREIFDTNERKAIWSYYLTNVRS